MSVAAISRISGCSLLLVAYWPAMLPVPTMPMPRGIMGHRVGHRLASGEAGGGAMPYRDATGNAGIEGGEQRRAPRSDRAPALHGPSTAGHRPAGHAARRLPGRVSGRRARRTAAHRAV